MKLNVLNITPVLRERLFSVAHLKGVWVIPETRPRVRRPYCGAAKELT